MARSAFGCGGRDQLEAMGSLPIARGAILQQVATLLATSRGKVEIDAHVSSRKVLRTATVPRRNSFRSVAKTSGKRRVERPADVRGPMRRLPLSPDRSGARHRGCASEDQQHAGDGFPRACIHGRLSSRRICAVREERQVQPVTPIELRLFFAAEDLVDGDTFPELRDMRNSLAHEHADSRERRAISSSDETL